MISQRYQICMGIGDLFEKIYGDIEAVKNWSASEECATVAQIVYELLKHLDIPCAVALGLVMMYATKGVYNVDDHMWDDYCKGFLAGQILGEPNPENLQKAFRAEEMWKYDVGEKYGYYQEVLNEVK